MPRLIVNPGSNSVWEIQLKAGPNSVGRSETNDCAIPHPSISGSHCQIVVGDGSAQLADLGSTNGTFLGEERVQQVSLRDGERIRLGEVELMYCQDLERPSVPSAAVPLPPPRAQAMEPSTRATMNVAQLHAPVEQAKLRPAKQCRFHPAMAARFFCAACSHFFCEACVATLVAEGVQQKFCRRCGKVCNPIEIQYEEVTEKTFFQRLGSAFLYPLRGAGAFMVIIGIVIVAMLKGGQALLVIGNIRAFIFGVILEVCAGGYLFTYLQAIVHSTTAEDREMPDLPGISNIVEDILIPFVRLLGLTAICFAPALSAGLWIHFTRQTSALPLFQAAVILGFLYFPMGFLAVAVFDAATAANPLLVVPSILKALLKYLCVLLVLAAAFATQTFAKVFIAKAFPEGATTHAMGELFALLGSIAFSSFLTLYLLIVGVHLLGLIYVTSKSALNWPNR
jgi:FHA domain-containing protein